MAHAMLNIHEIKHALDSAKSVTPVAMVLGYHLMYRYLGMSSSFAQDFLVHGMATLVSVERATQALSEVEGVPFGAMMSSLFGLLLAASFYVSAARSDHDLETLCRAGMIWVFVADYFRQSSTRG